MQDDEIDKTADKLVDLQEREDTLLPALRQKYTKEEMVLWIGQFKYGDVDSLDYQRKIIDIFINSIQLDDDKIIFTYNYKDGTETISLKDIEGSDLFSEPPPFQESASNSLQKGASFCFMRRLPGCPFRRRIAPGQC